MQVVPHEDVQVLPQTLATLATHVESHVLQPLAAAHCVVLATHVEPQLAVQVLPQTVPTWFTQLASHVRVAQLSPLNGVALALHVAPQVAEHVFPHVVATLLTHEAVHLGDGQRSLAWHCELTRLMQALVHALPDPLQQLGIIEQTVATQGSQVVASFAPVAQ